MATATSRVTRTWIAGRRRRKIYVWCNRLAGGPVRQLPGPAPAQAAVARAAAVGPASGRTGRPAGLRRCDRGPTSQVLPVATVALLPGAIPGRISRPNFPTGLVEARPRDSARLDPGRPRFPADAQGRASAPFVSRPRRWHRASECLCRRHRSRRARALRRDAASVERQLSCREEPRLRCGY